MAITVIWGHAPDEFVAATEKRFHLIEDNTHESPSFIFPAGAPKQGETVRFYTKPEECRNRGHHRHAIRWTIRVIPVDGEPKIPSTVRVQRHSGVRPSGWYHSLGPWWAICDVTELPLPPVGGGALTVPETTEDYSHYFDNPEVVTEEDLADLHVPRKVTLEPLID